MRGHRKMIVVLCALAVALAPALWAQDAPAKEDALKGLGKVYKDAKKGFSLHPPAKWERVKKTPKGKAAEFHSRGEEGQRITATVVIEKNDKDLDERLKVPIVRLRALLKSRRLLLQLL